MAKRPVGMRADAVWHRQGRALAGRAQIRSALDERPRSQRIRHVVSNPFIAEQSDDAVRMIAYMIGYRADEGVSKPAPQVAAVYQPLAGGTNRAHEAL